ncbi:MAG: alanine--tRNA ligase [Bacteroidales bacterium]|nr:alanine--tRNA ligase [Bacteroidales bacterium]
MDSSKIRQTFLDFFTAKQHQVVPSAPMVIKDDPTLMFTNAGMNQFKDIFLGNRESETKRIADTQKCLRVSGKHNDLEEVGHDTYHHTMFEMLGNWSFGDYFKKEAIEWAWELLTDVFHIDKERLYITVFEGDKTDGLAMDADALACWKELIPEGQILYGSKKDNFWEMGNTGPCGPCSEIHIDLRPDAGRTALSGRELVNTGNPLVIEIWNLVFIEFNRQSDGKLVPLPAKHVDTGMGFERLCMVLQGKVSNYDTDVFQPLINALANLAGMPYGSDPKADIAMRVVADHLRAISFAIADGQLPSNVKAGYVIRRILRRAVRFGYVFLNFREPFICNLVPVLAEQMGKFFPELLSQQQLIENVIREEENSFLRTLEQGIQKFQHYVGLPQEGRRTKDEGREKIQHPASSIIDGAFAFELYDTYGFPIDLTELMAREIGWRVDMDGFREGMKRQKERSRQAATVDASDWIVLHEDAGMTEFVGYETLKTTAAITRYRKVTGKTGELYQVVLDITPFYAESGGQCGDKGWLRKGEEVIEVQDTIREHEQTIHITARMFSEPAGEVVAEVDASRRLLTASNHTATHLMHAALRTLLGTHVEQKGSLVDETRLRFDFTHFSKMTAEEIEQVEKLVNARIRENIPQLEKRGVPMAEAREMGTIALFGEKYGDEVRVIRFGDGFSTELCGGTHASSTGQIGLFRIISEGAIAAGIRRIEAVTGAAAETYMYGKEQLLAQVSEALKHPTDLMHGIHHLQEENQELKKAAGEYAKLKQAQMSQTLKNKIERLNGLNFLGLQVDLDMDSMKGIASELRSEVADLFLILASESVGKANLVIAISDSLIKEKNLNAGSIIRELAKEIQGGGGGQPHIATAGGKHPAGIPSLLERASKMAESFAATD